MSLTGSYLNALESDPDALDALRKSAGLYRGLGTYGPDNQAGLAGGSLEAAHRAMNDMLLRSLGVDVYGSRKDLALNPEDDKKFMMTSQAMNSIQSEILGAVMDPQVMAALSPEKQQMAAVYQDFFQRNGMLGG